MSDALSVQVAKAVLADLQSASLSLEFQAERGYDTETSVSTLAALGKPLLTVLSAIEEDEILARRRKKGDYTVYVAVRKKLSARSTAEIDPLVRLAEEVVDLFLGKRPATLGGVACTDATMKVIFSPEELRRDAVYFGVVQLVFHGEVAIA